MNNPLLYFQCCNCRLEFYIQTNTLKEESSDDLCCPVCRMTTHMVHVVGDLDE